MVCIGSLPVKSRSLAPLRALDREFPFGRPGRQVYRCSGQHGSSCCCFLRGSDGAPCQHQQNRQHDGHGSPLVRWCGPMWGIDHGKAAPNRSMASRMMGWSLTRFRPSCQTSLASTSRPCAHSTSPR